MRGLEHDGQLVDHETEAGHRRRHEEQQARKRCAGRDATIRGPPRIKGRGQGPAPQPVRLPQPRAAVDRGKERAHGAHAAAGHEIHPDTGFGQRANRAGVVGAIGACAGENQRRPSVWRVFGGRDGDFGHERHSPAAPATSALPSLRLRLCHEW